MERKETKTLFDDAQEALTKVDNGCTYSRFHHDRQTICDALAHGRDCESLLRECSLVALAPEIKERIWKLIGDE